MISCAKKRTIDFPPSHDKECPMKRYTCSDYRQEMMLAGLRRQLSDPQLSEADRKTLEERIRRLEVEMGLE
jgi:hypothetical protein